MSEFLGMCNIQQKFILVLWGIGILLFMWLAFRKQDKKI